MFHFLTDHLGSTTVTVNSAGSPVGELRYRAFGSTRFASGSPGTEYRYTGQREESSTGLYYYRARWYDPALARFVQPDTILPGPGSAQALDRYAYVLNNPVKNADPSGHRPCENGNCQINPNAYRLTYEFGLILRGNDWTSRELQDMTVTARRIRNYVDSVSEGRGQQWSDKYLAGTSVERRGPENPLIVRELVPEGYSAALPGWVPTIGTNTVYLDPGFSRQTFAHELAHIWDTNTGGIGLGVVHGVADLVNDFIGGDVLSTGGCRFCNPGGFPTPPSSHIPPGYRFAEDVNGGYGNGSTADYLAEAFSWRVFNPDYIPSEDVAMWIDAMVALQALVAP